MKNKNIYKEFMNQEVRIIKQEGSRIYTLTGKLTYLDDKVIKLDGDTVRIIDRSIIKEIQLIDFKMER